MANAYSNQLRISGDEEVVRRFAEDLADPTDPDRPLAFERLLPEPDELDGYAVLRWREQNWGMKYAPASANLLHEILEEPAPDRERVFLFTSDGQPATVFVAACAARYPQLEFELVYHEPGNGVAGFARFDQGRTVEGVRSNDPDECVALLKERWPDELPYWE